MPVPDDIGSPFRTEELSALEVLAGLPPFTVAVNDPPWATLAAAGVEPNRVVSAWDMNVTALDAMAEVEDASSVVVGIGGGTALDTAKFLAWKTGKRLIQIPTITSVDAGFTTAIGVRDAGHVRYIGDITPELVVLDLALIRSAPARLNRAGIGDILSCHTGLHDWQAASSFDQGHPWREDLATLARTLLAELDDAAEEIHAVTDDGVRFMASAYRRIGAACTEAGHSRFEEGSEHFWAYCYEHASGAHQVHGELIALGVVALSHVQGNEAEWAKALVQRCGTRSHPDALAITRDQFIDALTNLREYARSESLDISVADLSVITPAVAHAAWEFVQQLPS